MKKTNNMRVNKPVLTSSAGHTGSIFPRSIAKPPDEGPYCGRLLHPICGGRMYRIDAYVFCDLAIHLNNLEHLEVRDELALAARVLEAAERELEPIGRDTGYHSIPLPRSTKWATSLREMAGKLIEKGKATPREPLGFDAVVGLRTSVRRLLEELSYDLAEVPFFYVPTKGLYSTVGLLERATDMFPKTVMDRIPTVAEDWREAGMCLALDLATAAAFHIFRVVEEVSKHYAITFKGKRLDEGTERGLGGHVRVLRQTGANKNVVSFLDQFRHLHRNPTSHRTGLLTQDQVLITFSVAQGLIQAMVADMERKSAAPDPSVIQLLPD